MLLVACPECRTHYDVSVLEQRSFNCSCGAAVEVQPVRPVDAAIQRCGACGAPVDRDAKVCDYCRAPIVREGELSLICPECYARNPTKSRFCTACGIVFRPQPLPEDVHDVPCLKCKESMALRAIGGTPVYECAKCNGVWVPGNRFDELVTRAVEAWKKTDPDRLDPMSPRRTGGNPVANRVEYRKCPECDSVMNRTNYRRTSGVIIDRCNEHGTWLDADELERIAGFILSGGLDRAKAAEASTMKTPLKFEIPGEAHGASEFASAFGTHYPVANRAGMLLDSAVKLLSRLLG